jgi:hypothetical protein
MPFLLKRMLAILLIAGLGVSPLYASAMQGMKQSAEVSSMAGMADDMPCHPAKSSPDKSSSDKACPFMVVCLSLCFQSMPPIADGIVAPATIKLRKVFEHVRELASLTPSPPARPPRV